jgi:hypothetical protein
MVTKCLKRQERVDWEWLVSTNYDPPEPARQVGMAEKGNYFYSLNRDWNRLYREAKGELIVNIVDLLWFPPDTLTRLYNHYMANPKALVSGIGNQYEKVLNNKPENQIWTDPRAGKSDKSFFEVIPDEMEMCLCSIPRQAILDCGGLDEEFDHYAALSEKEMCWRMSKLGYSFFIDKTIEYRALKHGRLNGSEAWNKAYFKGCKYFGECLSGIETQKRPLNVGFIDKQTP